MGTKYRLLHFLFCSIIVFSCEDHVAHAASHQTAGAPKQADETAEYTASGIAEENGEKSDTVRIDSEDTEVAFTGTLAASKTEEESYEPIGD